jgi:hypothetical protein
MGRANDRRRRKVSKRHRSWDTHTVLVSFCLAAWDLVARSLSQSRVERENVLVRSVLLPVDLLVPCVACAFGSCRTSLGFVSLHLASFELTTSKQAAVGADVMMMTKNSRSSMQHESLSRHQSLEDDGRRSPRRRRRVIIARRSTAVAPP